MTYSTNGVTNSNYLSMRCTVTFGLGHDNIHASHDVSLPI